MDDLPKLSVDLLKKLNEMYPDKIVTRELSPYELGYQNGVIDLLRFLNNLIESEDK